MIRTDDRTVRITFNEAVTLADDLADLGYEELAAALDEARRLVGPNRLSASAAQVIPTTSKATAAQVALWVDKEES